MNYVKRFERNTTGRDLIVGDIHGCFSLLGKKLEEVNFQPDLGDRLFSVGDLVDRGPESDHALEWLSKPWFHAVQGNHESMAMFWANGELSAGHYVANGGAWNVGNPSDTSQEFAAAFAALPVAIEIDTAHGVIGVVHADCPAPSWQQFITSLESELISTDERAHLIGSAQWSRKRCDSLMGDGVSGIRALVVGHTPMERMTSLGNVIFIDTGGWLPGRKFTVLDALTLRPADPMNRALRAIEHIQASGGIRKLV